MTKRRSFTDQFKAKIALEALRGEKTIQEIAAKYQVHLSQVSTRKRDLAPVIPPLVSRVCSGFALFGLGDQQARARSHCGAQAIGPVGF